MMNTRTYYYRGQIERGKNYTWKDGYSANSERGNILYPWNTKKECRHDAKVCGLKAVFVDTRL